MRLVTSLSTKFIETKFVASHVEVDNNTILTWLILKKKRKPWEEINSIIARKSKRRKSITSF